MADLITLAQVKARVEVTDAADDTLLDELIDQVSDWIQEFTERSLTAEAGATYYVDTQAGSEILITRGVRAVTSLEVATADQPDSGGTYTAVAAADILLRPLAIDRKPGWPPTRIVIAGKVARLVTARNGARITGDFGFAATPPAIQGVAIDAVVNAFTSRQGPTDQGIGEGDTPAFPWSRYFGSGSPQRATLERYRRGGAGFGIG